MALSLGGILMVSETDFTKNQQWIGDVLALASAFLYAVYGP